jgi:hypothetical protein
MATTDAPLRPSLPSRTRRPAVTAALDSFGKAISEINDFYWGARAGFDALRRLRPSDARHPAEFIEPAIAAHLNVDLPEFDRRLDEQPLRLHYLCLVDSVTFYEEFLLKTLVRELPTRGELKRGKSIEAQAKNIINGSYETRAANIDDALQLDIVSRGSEHDLKVDDLTTAFLARNCIVHTGGVISAREEPLLKNVVPGVAAGQRLPLDEPLLKRFLGAMWQHAQDVDLLVRVDYQRP